MEHTALAISNQEDTQAQLAMEQAAVRRRDEEDAEPDIDGEDLPNAAASSRRIETGTAVLMLIVAGFLDIIGIFANLLGFMIGIPVLGLVLGPIGFLTGFLVDVCAGIIFFCWLWARGFPLAKVGLSVLGVGAGEFFFSALPGWTGLVIAFIIIDRVPAANYLGVLSGK